MSRESSGYQQIKHEESDKLSCFDKNFCRHFHTSCQEWSKLTPGVIAGGESDVTIL